MESCQKRIIRYRTDARSAFKDAKKKLVKFTDVATKLDWVPIFRYAETLLDLAECYANTTGGEGTAKELLKRVRYRSLPEDVDPLDIDALSGDGLKEAIYNEKRLEFIGEGIRGIDIIRRGENFVQGRELPFSPKFRLYMADSSGRAID